MSKFEDNLLGVYHSFMKERTDSLNDKFKGFYRALVVETNDPLNVHRVRFKMPEIHNFDLEADECPWAVPSFQHGGKGTGNFTYPAIGDIIWISFEKGHPYGPIWVGHAEPTRRRYFKLYALYNKVQIPVDEQGKPDQKPTDEPLDDYLPKDGRPYSLGYKDRYGTMFLMDATGWFPKEHDIDPAPVGVDAISQSQFKNQKSKPEINKPDRKMASIISKYGHYMVLSDSGYKWDNEFTGDFEKDYDKEKKRNQNLIKLLNEDVPDSSERDQRRIEFRTDYGHKIEMRDVGWAQKGPTESKGRSKDWFEDENLKSDFEDRDERWAKIRTKGGMLMQFMDMGNDPSQDTFVRRNRIEETGGKADHEDDSWQGRDARQMRFVSRYGFKMVLDDRGSDKTKADELETPHGNGVLIKGRRIPNLIEWIDSGDETESNRTVPAPSLGYNPLHNDLSTPRGFGIDINEKNPFNRMMIYSPSSKVLEFNDRFGYIMLCTDTKTALSKEWKYLDENEFATAIAMTYEPEKDTFHLKLDRSNEYLVLGSPMQQAFEIRDGHNAIAEAFIEMRDHTNRATVHSEELKLSAVHDGRLNKYMVLDDDKRWILVHNKEGKIQIFGQGKIEIASNDDINCSTPKRYTINCSQFAVNAGTQFVVDGGGFGGTGPMSAPESYAFHIGVFPGPGAGPATPKGASAPKVKPTDTPKMIPSKRKYTVNGPFIEQPETKITDIE